MTTFDDDYVQINLRRGRIARASCRANAMTWPPPERLYLDEATGYWRAAETGDDPAFVLVQTRRSEITDEQRAGMDMVMRGAEYYYSDTVEALAITHGVVSTA